VFWVPVHTSKCVVPEVSEHDELRRPTLGVELASPQVSRRLGVEGALVFAVQPGSGADRAGILPTRRGRDGAIELGDVIVEVEGKAIASNNAPLLALERRSPGEAVEIGILRGGRRTSARVVL